MATGTGRLTWQNVAAPDFSGAVEAQRASALAFDSAMQRLGGAVQTFDNNRKDRADAAVLRNALQYQNADELQAAIASGALMQGVNPDHVRVDALLKAQAQAGQLMGLEKDRQQLATSKQAYDFNAQYNPLRLEKYGLENTQLGNEITYTQGERERAEKTRVLNEQINMEVAEKFRTGEFQDPRNVAAWVQQGGPVDSPEGLARWNAALKHNPALGQTFEQIGINMPMTDPVTGAVGGGTAPAAPFALPGNLGAQLAEREKAAGLPAGLMSSILQQEIGNRPEFLQDPTKYHYELNKDGKRIAGHTGKESTAFGPFGILESTAKDPGYGVKPLQNKSLEEQIRFASEYLAARIKAAGSVEAGLAGYGEGVKYAGAVMSRMNPATTTTSRQEAGAAANQAMVAVVDSANRSGVPLNQQYISALQMGINGKDDVSLRGTLARHKDAFSGINSDQLEKMLTEINQKTGNSNNFEFAAQFLKNLPTETLGKWREWVPGVRGSGKHFDPSQIQAAVEAFNAQGGMGLYNGAAAGYRANAALENQALMESRRNDLTKRYEAAVKAVQAGVPGATAQLQQIDAALTQASGAQDAQSRATFEGFASPALTNQAPPAPAPAVAPFTPPASGPAASTFSEANNFYSTAAVEQRKAAQLLREQVQAAAKAKNSAEAPRRLADTSRLTAQREKVKELTTDRIRAMSQAEAREVISQGLFPLLSPEQQKLIRTISRSRD